jgi:hypothetical protein
LGDRVFVKLWKGVIVVMGVLIAFAGVVVLMLSGYAMPFLLIVAAVLIVWGCDMEIGSK